MGSDAGEACGLSAGEVSEFGQIGSECGGQDGPGAGGGLDAPCGFVQGRVVLDGLGHGLVDAPDIGLKGGDLPGHEGLHGGCGEARSLALESGELAVQQPSAGGHFLDLGGGWP
ncbi:MAG: hypothetical protein MI755_09215, partial [Sphingomonadales bacterium]|nr:hypothetical protein [Sphingomonadales bacterium]